MWQVTTLVLRARIAKQKGRRAHSLDSKNATTKTPSKEFRMQDSAQVAVVTRPVLEQAGAEPTSVTVESFVCVACDRLLPADRLAFDTDPEHYLGVCSECEPEVIEAQERPAPWIAREVA